MLVKMLLKKLKQIINKFLGLKKDRWIEVDVNGVWKKVQELRCSNKDSKENKDYIPLDKISGSSTKVR